MTIKEILNKYHVKGGTHDQFFLINKYIINSIVLSLDLSKDDVILEVGGGIGNISEYIAPYVKKLYIIESDNTMINILIDRLFNELKFKNVVVIHDDVLNFDISNLKFTKIISNLPYSISSKFTIKLLKENFQFGIIMYQEEFANRLISKSGNKNYGRITIYSQQNADIKLILKVKKEYFYPIPKVNSAILKIIPIKNNKLLITNSNFYEKLVKYLFQYRRKKIKTTLIN